MRRRNLEPLVVASPLLVGQLIGVIVACMGGAR